MHRFLLLFSITIAGVCANDPVFITGSYGSQTLYRGYEAWVAVGVRWIHGTQFTVDPSTSVITAPGNSFKNGSTVYVRSDGTLPHPLVQYGGYTVTEATDNTFKLQSVKFDDEGTGTHIIGPSGNGRIYWTTPSGAPPGVTISFWC